MKTLPRSPWYAVAFILAVAVVISAALIVFGSERAAEARRAALGERQARLDRAALRVEDVLNAMGQVSRTQIMVIAPIRSRSEIVSAERRLQAARDRNLISGTGLLFAPYAFDPNTLSFGVYLVNGPKGTALQIYDSHRQEVYLSTPWFAIARQAQGEIAYIARYPALGTVYLGTVQGFYAHGRFAGATFVAVRLDTLRTLLAQTLQPGDSLDIVGAGNQRLWSTGTGTLGAQTTSLETPLRHAHWTVRLTSPLAATVGRTQLLITTLTVVVIWLFAAVTIVVYLRATFYHYRSKELEREIASRTFAEKQLREIAHRDSLTGLPNRLMVYEYISSLIDRTIADTDFRFCVCFVDLDRFALINDSLGHTAGDSILIMIAQRIAEVLPEDASFVRLGGDEFVICSAVGDDEQATRLAGNIVANIARPVAIAGHDITITGSLGVVLSADWYLDAEAMLRDADIAMYAAKDAGRARFAIFDRTMHERTVTRVAVEEQLRAALANDEIHAKYQPIIELSTGRVHAVEALARWNGGASHASTAEFIAVAEQSGLIGAVDTAILEETCRDAARIDSIARGLAFSVNLSATMLTHGNVLERIAETVERAGIAPERLKLELTETAFMGHPEEAKNLLERARARGFQVVIDDFGTGYSSLAYVQRLPIAGLKIDRSFVAPIMSEPRTAAIVRSVVALAHALGAHVTAEGIETREQLELLREIGVDYGQGWYFSKALSFEDLTEYLDAPASPVPARSAVR